MSERPNIVVTIADDQQADAIGTLESTDVITPTLDKMVGKGVYFTQAHHFGSPHGAVCAPSRAMLHTGKNYFNLPTSAHSEAFLKQLSEDQIQKDQKSLNLIPTLGELLGQHGYKTFGTGKWHNGTILFNKSFQDGGNIFFGGMSSHYKVPVHQYDTTGEYASNKLTIGNKFSTNLFLSTALEFINTYDDPDPFFLYVSFTAPHDPRTPPSQYKKMYPVNKMKVPPNFMSEHPFDNGCMYDIRDELLAPWPRTEEVIKKHIADYYGMITHMDWAIGQISNALERNKFSDNTLVIHTGDHGLALGQHGLLGKQNLYEHSVKVPLIITGPDIPTRNVNALVYQHDLFPTLLESANIQVPDKCEFKSLWGLLKNKPTQLRNTIYSSYTEFQRMVKNDRFKLVRFYAKEGKGVNRFQLFDYVNDPYELNDLINDATYNDLTRDLKSELDRWMRATNDPLAT